jgi:hypothetical protein
METLIPVLAVSAVIGLIAFVAYMAWRADKKRTEALTNLATTFGMQFTVAVPLGFVAGFGDLHLFTLGRNGTARNLMRGEIDGVAVGLFDYSYVTGHGKSRQTHRQTVVSLSLPSLALPSFNLRPENIFHKIGSALGFQDIDFPQAPNFSKQFLLRGAEESAIRAAFKPAALNWLEHHAGVSAEGRGKVLVYYRASQSLKPEEVRSFINDGRELAKLFAG